MESQDCLLLVFNSTYPLVVDEFPKLQLLDSNVQDRRQNLSSVPKFIRKVGKTTKKWWNKWSEEDK